MSVSPDAQWRSDGSLRDVFGRRYADTQVMMKPGYRGEHQRGFAPTRYMDEAERARREICFLGRCVHWKNRPHKRPSDALPGGTYIYVLSVDGGFYAKLNQPTDMRELHHSTIPAGRGLICAGMMEIDAQHRLVKVDNHSGHYMPDLSCLLKAVYLLRKAGCSIDDYAVGYVPPVGFGNPPMYNYASARQFLTHAPYPQ